MKQKLKKYLEKRTQKHKNRSLNVKTKKVEKLSFA